jgi:enamine deaminase RidA (YjgF/YER057c/UK114 family)
VNEPTKRIVAFAAATMLLTSPVACGSSSKANPVGAAAGQGFAHFYDPVPWKSATVLAKDFVSWVSGQMANDPNASGPPGSPLSTSERHAAAQVVLRYALQLVSKGQLPAKLSNGQTISAYLEQNGVN